MSRPLQSAETVGKGCGIFGFAFFALGGLVALVFVWASLWGSARTLFWDRTPCTIVSSGLKEPKPGKQVLEINYAYQVHGRTYTGTQLKPSGNEFTDATKAQRTAREYRSGRSQTCYVNPSAPSESVLQPMSRWIALMGLVPLSFFVLGVSGAVWMWRTKSPAKKPLSERASQRGGAIALRLIGFFFAAVGALFTYLMWLGPWLELRQSASWLEVPCVVQTSGIKTHDSSEGGPTYSIEMTYRYVVDGDEFIGTRYNFTTSSSNARAWRERVVAAYPPGRSTICYVNPKDPLDSVIVREMSSDAWFGLFGGLFVLVGLGMFIAGSAAARRARSAAAGTSLAGAAPRRLHGAIGDVPISVETPLTLKPATSPLVSFLVLLLFALFWNGIVWGILLAAKPHGPGKFFLGIFAVIGVAILAAAAHQLLTLFNPRPLLQANASAVRLGESMDLRFGFTGRVQRIRRLTLRLKGEEVATYRRGTDTRTDRHVFHETLLMDTSDHAAMQAGNVPITIPAGAMHSFAATNNKIEWKLELHGEIPRWPNLKLEFPITVLPRAIAPHP
jgi:hypothetical protein